MAGDKLILMSWWMQSCKDGAKKQSDECPGHYYSDLEYGNLDDTRKDLGV